MNADEFLKASKKIKIASLQSPKARELANLLKQKSLNFVELVECRKTAGTPGLDIVIFSIEVERSQHLVNKINQQEEIAVIFDPSDKTVPEVLALRGDFPRTPHTNLRSYEKPISLCLYERPYSEIKHQWTATRFIKQIHKWLSDTAVGKLHGIDQPLEPIFEDPNVRLVLPNDLLINADSSEAVIFHGVKVCDEYTLIAEKDAPEREDDKQFIATLFSCNPIEHGVITKRPANFKELNDFVNKTGLDMLSGLRERLNKWNSEKKVNGLLSKKLLIVVVFPKKRTASSTAEVSDIYCFSCCETISKIGEEIGVWQLDHRGIPGQLIGGTKNDGRQLRIDLCKTMFAFSKEMALKMNGIVSQEDQKYSLIGAGALGSQFFMNLARSGFGVWNFIDGDLFLPHNLARHALQRFDIGHSKASRLAQLANYMLGQDVVKEVFIDNILQPKKDKDKMDSALNSSDTIIDCSASVSVPRYLARESKLTSRIVSYFLNPSGTDLIMLCEDKQKHFPIDAIEMQYLCCTPLSRPIFSFEGGLNFLRSCQHPAF